MNYNHYSVGWKRNATHKFGKLFNVKHEIIFDKSSYLLSEDPYRYACGKADYPGFEFNGITLKGLIKYFMELNQITYK
jgi:hypothetical protein